MSYADTLLLLFLIGSLLTGAVVASVGRVAVPDERDATVRLLLMVGVPMVSVLLVVLMRWWPISATPLLEWAAPVADPIGRVVEAGPVRPGLDMRAMLSAVVWSAMAFGWAVHALRLALSYQKLRQTVRRADRTVSHLWTPDIIPPFSWADREVVLPAFLKLLLSPQEIGLIVDHERAHIRRRDSRRFALLAIIDVMFWFNPFVRRQTSVCRHAAERAVDAEVIGRAPDMRKAYAASLIMVLKHTAGGALHGVPAVFSPGNTGETRMRIEAIMGATPRPHKPRWRWAAIAAIPVCALQVAMASGLLAAQTDMMRMPTTGKVTSGFGERTHPISVKKKMHKGIDIAAPLGTPVVAAAAGVVIFAEMKDAYGNIVVIDHGNGTTTKYAQLASMSVKPQDRVTAGQVIGTVGASGQATGPHLHFEVYVGTEAIDPATVLPM